MVSHLLGEPELAFQQRRPATGVHHPTGLDLPFAALVEDTQAMRVALWLQANLLHLAAIEKGNPLLWESAAQGILQAAPVELVSADALRWESSMAEFHAPGNILVAIEAEE